MSKMRVAEDSVSELGGVGILLGFWADGLVSCPARASVSLVVLTLHLLDSPVLSNPTASEPHAILSMDPDMPAAQSGQIAIGDHLMAVDGQELVGQVSASPHYRMRVRVVFLEQHCS